MPGSSSPPPTVRGTPPGEGGSTDLVGGSGARQLSVTVAVDSRAIAYPLPRRGRITIGRDPSADFSIDHRSLSRQHAVLNVGAGLTIEDSGSTNGTYVGGQALATGVPCPLKIGDTVDLGAITMVVYAWSGEPAGGPDFLWSLAAFQARLDYECARSQRTHDPLCVAAFRSTGDVIVGR